MFHLKITVFGLLAACLISSCSFSQESLNKSVENREIGGPQPSATIEPNVNDSNNVKSHLNPDSNQNDSFDLKYPSPHQTKPRRKKIEFSEDCHPSIVMGSKNWQLRKACGDAFLAVKSDLPEKCDYNTFRDSDGSNYFSFFRTAQVKFYPLFPNKYLAELRCTTGAYNVLNVYLLYDESAIPAKAEVLEFPSLEITHDEDSDIAKSVEKITVNIIGGRWFNPKTKELIVFSKSRGIGDAGDYARYSFPNGKPKLKEFRAKFKWAGRSYQAGDVIKSPPKTWKRYYPK